MHREYLLYKFIRQRRKEKKRNNWTISLNKKGKKLTIRSKIKIVRATEEPLAIRRALATVLKERHQSNNGLLLVVTIMPIIPSVTVVNRHRDIVDGR